MPTATPLDSPLRRPSGSRAHVASGPECPQCGAVVSEGVAACGECGFALPRIREFAPFTLLEPLGRGGMGEVYRAYDRTLLRNIAVKLLRADYLRDSGRNEELRREAEITASITHPHVVKVLYTGEEHGLYYIAMELLGGGTLAEAIEQRGQISEREALSAILQAAHGLKAGVDCGLLHRDVKPGNLLFADANTVKIVDFGLALPLSEAMASGDEVWGTPFYCAPEKILSQGEDVRSDIYGLGATLFHALAGRPVFKCKSPSEVAQRHVESRPPGVQTFAPHVSGATAFVVNRCLAKAPEERYQDYESLIEHLEYAMAEVSKVEAPGQVSAAAEGVGAPVAPAPKHAVRKLQETENRTATWITLATAAAISVMIGFGFYFWTSAGSSSRNAAPRGTTSLSASALKSARDLMGDRRYNDAARLFEGVAQNAALSASERDLAAFQAALAYLFAGNNAKAVHSFSVFETGPSPEWPRLAAAARFCERDGSTPFDKSPDLDRDTVEALGLAALGLHDYLAGDLENAESYLHEVSLGRPDQNEAWLREYKLFTDDLARDIHAAREALNAFDPASPATWTPETLNAIKAARKRLAGNAVSSAILSKKEAELEPLVAKHSEDLRKLSFRPRALPPLPAAMQSALVAYWRLDETEGDRVRDSGPNHCDGRVEGNVLRVTDGPGRAYQFTDKSRVRIPSSKTINLTKALSFTGWFKTTQKADLVSAIRHDGHFTPLQPHGGVALWVGERLCFLRYDWKYSDGVWRQITATYDQESGVNLYIDGDLIAQSSEFKGPLHESSTELVLGSSEKSDEQYIGFLSDVAVWNRALGPEEVRLLSAK